MFLGQWTGPVVRRPMIGVAGAVVAGMSMGSLDVIPPWIVFLSTLITLVLSITLIRFNISSILTLISVALIAACRFLVADPEVSGASIISLSSRLPINDVQITGSVSGSPEFRAYQKGHTGTWLFPVKCRAIHVSESWRTIAGEINVRLMNGSSEAPLHHGEPVHLKGSLRRSLFPHRNVMEMEIITPDDCIRSPVWRIPSLIATGSVWRDTAAVRLDKDMSSMPIHQAVLKALVLGQRSEVPAEVMDRFRRTGTLHIFAISGLHVGIVGLLLAGMLKTFGIPRDHFCFYLLPLLTLYVAATGMKPSALRALTMAFVYVLAPLFRRKPDIPSTVAFAAVFLLFLDPSNLLSAGFIYSFVVVAFIVMVFASLSPGGLKGGWMRRYTTSLFITSLAAGLASIPLTALYFGMFSPIAFAGNLIVVPMTFFIVLSGWLSVLIPFASSIFNHAGTVFIHLLLSMVEYLDRVPGSSWQVNPPPVLAVLLWYSSLIFLFTHARNSTQRVYAGCGAGCAVLLALLA